MDGHRGMKSLGFDMFGCQFHYDPNKVRTVIIVH